MKLQGLSGAKLDRLVEAAEREIERRRTLAAKLVAFLRATGLDRAQLRALLDDAPASAARAAPRRRKGKKRVTTKRATPRGARIAPKYRDPKNAQMTWTGRGSQPRWVRAWLEARKGRKLDDLLIKPAKG